jgi:cytochrome c
MLKIAGSVRLANLFVFAGLGCSAYAAAQDAAAPCDLNLGKQVFVVCAACHALAPGEMKHEGPSLSEVYGRAAAGDKTFKYSPAMLASGLTWDAATLDRFLTNPRRALPGTVMSFPGLEASGDRSAVICYLRKGGTQ